MLGPASWWSVALVASIGVTLRLADASYYRDSAPVLRTIGLRPRYDGPAGVRRRLDPVFAVVPFAWAWCDIAATTMAARRVDRAWGWLLLCLLVATRLRFLQEVAHTALHGGLCRSRRWQAGLADALANAPTFRADTAHRFEAHVRQHHWHVNEPEVDPNIARFIRIGFVPGMTRTRYRRLLVHPFTPAGLGETITVARANVGANQSRTIAWLRAASVAITIAGFVLLGGWIGLVVGYLVALVVLYPFFSWISLLVEHRWFVACADTDRWRRECTLGRPTTYPGVGGWLVSHALFPASDRYHLAHSLFPSLRWNHLPAVDAALRLANVDYERHASVGLVFGRAVRPTALSELRDRMTGRLDDLAPWAASIGAGDLVVGDHPHPTIRGARRVSSDA